MKMMLFAFQCSHLLEQMLSNAYNYSHQLPTPSHRPADMPAPNAPEKSRPESPPVFITDEEGTIAFKKEELILVEVMTEKEGRLQLSTKPREIELSAEQARQIIRRMQD